jgi:hypothetical protein
VIGSGMTSAAFSRVKTGNRLLGSVSMIQAFSVITLPLIGCDVAQGAWAGPPGAQRQSAITTG